MIVILAAGTIFVLLGGQVKPAIGTSLLASGFVGFLELVYRYVVREDTRRTDAMTAAGLFSIFDHRDLDRYHTLMHERWQRLDILGYSLRNFYESFGQTLLDRAQADSKICVRILVVNPATAQSKAKEAAEGHAAGTFATAIEAMKVKYNKVANIEIRLLEEDFTTMVFRIDDVMFVGPQFQSLPSKATPTFEMQKGKNAWLFHAYEREFDALWNPRVLHEKRGA
ncbi:MAG TPA: hypothetical protein VJZ71_11030 [Phycisphaerae bacterium]|nr:hypothetical protein [Phycisphaerae bacterium]